MEAVGSVRSQHFADFELLIVDDGSDPLTARRLDEIAASDSRVRVLHQPASGLAAALNRAIAQARAPYLARLDADDRARPDRLGRQFAVMEAQPAIALLGSFADIIDENGAIIGRLTPPVDAAKLKRVLARTNPFIHSSVMMRSALVRHLGGYRAAFCAAEDYDLWLRMAEASGIAIIPEPLVQYRRHSCNVTRLDDVRQSFSQRLAQLSATGRRSGKGDPAAALTAPPDWWQPAADSSFYAADAAFHRFLDDGAECGPAALAAVQRRLFSLNHRERKMTQLRLHAMLEKMGSPLGVAARLRIWLWIALLHPARALTLAFRRRK
jgi:glycosyltransferase involved in cell wall biosynthesis